MPTTLSSIVVFVSLLVPGFVYLNRIESHLPGRKFTALRETASVVTTSLLTNTLTLALFGLLRILSPKETPDVGLLVQNPSTYFKGHYAEVTIWGAALLATSIFLSAAFAVPPAWVGRVFAEVEHWPGPQLNAALLRRRRGSITPESGWGRAFYRYADSSVHLGLQLRDGSYVYGRLLEFNPQIDETGDRSLQLAGPIELRAPGGEKPKPIDADVMIIGAGEIKTITVHYLPSDTS